MKDSSNSVNRSSVSKLIYALLILMVFSSSCSQSAKQDGWEDLFDGKTLNGWKVLAGEAKFDAVEGEIVGTTVMNTGNTFLVTEKEYGDFVLELEIKVEDPAGNSGVQTRSHYDPAGNKNKGKVYGRQVELDPTDRRWTGGIYDEGRRNWLYPLTLHPEAQNAYKAGEYNHIKVECIGDEMKTWVNGIPTAHLIDTIDSSGFIALQVHAIYKEENIGKKVHFRNIRIKTENLEPEPFPDGIFMVNTKPNDLSDYEKRNGWSLLFDGKSAQGWTGAGKPFPADGWTVKDGILTVLSTKEAHSKGGPILTEKQFGPFDFSFEFRITPGANSGVKYLVTLTDDAKPTIIGLEYQIYDDRAHPGTPANTTMASLYELVPAEIQSRFLKPAGQWNTGRIVLFPDKRVEHYLNGIKVLECTRGTQEFRDLVAKSKFKKYENYGEGNQGYILLQEHNDEVSFRSLKIKEL